MQYGLIGATLKHSFSVEIHSYMGTYPYELCELASAAAFDEFMQRRDFKGINVTIPYKQSVIPYCDNLSARAAAIGAVNTIINKNGKLIGYNTDFDGFERLAQSVGADLGGKTVMLLGTGGTQKTAAAVAMAHGAKELILVSRHASDTAISYAEAVKRTDTDIIVNTSPVGMYPHSAEMPINLDAFPRLCAVLDAVYNPLETRLVAAARAKGIPAANGLIMLLAQGKRAAELFVGSSCSDERLVAAHRQMRERLSNIVLIGMPSCGKSSIGKHLSAELVREYIDIDAMITHSAGKSISDIFSEDGERAFRILEAQAISEVCSGNSRVIATGGGAILNADNIKAMRQNGIVIYIKRPPEELVIGGARPLSTSGEALKLMYDKRAPLYTLAADAQIDNTKSIYDAVLNIKEKINEVLNTKWT